MMDGLKIFPVKNKQTVKYGKYPVNITAGMILKQSPFKSGETD